ncbi:DUF5908 family protein [Dyadobacter fanqingshengii]|uniref:DUF5908 family protein n=1 Tax=Dyadobacter fanqingshengii TaxID=2906443 RepID=A0A9X1P9X5_9BACT|nr:DUF5908 family protein [Dyadobacter fanqingshengii]MCF0039773.1 DUF5908 family protein [Dyadobacter fanqingshengii]USJ38464.1 DUF5908 family protein [Dyadobacter fanqingshengii]
MPIEIKELIIRTTVDAAEEKPTGASKPAPGTESILLGIRELTRLIKEKNER